MTAYAVHHSAVAATADLALIAAHYSDRPWLQLLDSAAPGHPDHRWQLLVLNPLATLTSHHGQHQLNWRDGRSTETASDLVALQHQLLAELGPRPAHPELPFVGGLVGYWGYDLARQFERLPQQASADLSLPDLAIGLYDQALLLDLQQHQLYALANSDAEAQQLLTEAQQRLSRPAAEHRFQLTAGWRSNLSKAQYLERFVRVQQHLRDGDCYQVNLAQRFSAPFSGSPWAAYARLRQANGAPFGAYIQLPQGSVLCLSPERFLQLKGKQLTTRPIKGTRPRVEDPAQEQAVMAELASSTKERAENVMIVDLLRNDLGKVAEPGSVHVPELFTVERYPYVYHLVSTVSARLATGHSGLTALRACFPGGSITGAPKLRAMSVIDALEPQRRNLYCGAILYLSACGHMDSNIAIRTALCCDGQIHVWGGGGLVIDSDGEAEYRETLDKLARILPLLEQP